MGKLIIVSFAFMAFAFYELSGGADFVPIADEKRAALAAETEARRVAEAEQIAERAKDLVVARPAALDIATTQVVLASATDASEPVSPTEVANAVEAALDADKTLALTETAPASSAAAPEPESIPADLREVTAARVNMRNGPGQNFDVVSKLNGGDTVEILQDPGDGWVKLRVVDNGRVGWMADFLLTAANN